MSENDVITLFVIIAVSMACAICYSPFISKKLFGEPKVKDLK
jgi:hypothetical protein